MEPTPEDDSLVIQSFYTSFHTESSTLDELISNLGTLPPATIQKTIDQYLVRINQLSDRVKEAANYLPAYDQRKYAENVRALLDKLNATKKVVLPKQKFSFKSKAATSSGSNTAASTVSTQDARRIHPTSSAPPSALTSKATTPATPTPNDPHHISVENLTHTHHIIPPFPTPTPLHITNTVSTILTLHPSSAPNNTDAPSVLALNNVKNSIIILPHIIGPAHLTSLENVILVVSCKQFRMHKAKNVTVILRCPSRPIIEHCSELRFYKLGFWGSSEEEVNRWDQVDDFNWLRMEKSPNWKIGDVGEGVDVEELAKAVGISINGEPPAETRLEGNDITEVLRRFLPAGVDG